MCACATSVVKYFLFLFNLVFVVGAIAYIALGIVFKLNIDEVTESIEKGGMKFSLAPMLAIVVGVVVFFIAFFGCCGAIRESTCMLTTYAVILLTLFILQVALGVYAFLQYKNSNEDIKQEISTELEKTFSKYYQPSQNRNIQEAVDALQSNVQCCGTTGPDYWRRYNTASDQVPASCCPNKPPSCYRNGAYQEGCVPKLYDFLNNSFRIIGIIIIVVAAVELGGAVMSLCLSSSIRNAERRGNYA